MAGPDKLQQLEADAKDGLTAKEIQDNKAILDNPQDRKQFVDAMKTPEKRKELYNILKQSLETVINDKTSDPETKAAALILRDDLFLTVEDESPKPKETKDDKKTDKPIENGPTKEQITDLKEKVRIFMSGLNYVNANDALQKFEAAKNTPVDPKLKSFVDAHMSTTEQDNFKKEILADLGGEANAQIREQGEKQGVLTHQEAIDITAFTQGLEDILKNGNSTIRYNMCLSKIYEKDPQGTEALRKSMGASPANIQAMRNMAEGKEVTASTKDKLNKSAPEVNAFLAANSKEKDKAKNIGEIFEQTSKSIKEMLFNQVSTALKKDPYLSEDGKLTATGEIVQKKIEATLTPERMDNLSFALLDKLIGNISNHLTKDGNKDQQISDKVTLLMTLQNVLKNGGMKDLKDLPPALVSATDISRKALQNFQKNFDAFITARLLDEGFDRTSKKTRRKSIMKLSDYSNIRLAVDKKARNESVVDVISSVFEKAFLYFDNQNNSQQFVNALMPSSDKALFSPASLSDAAEKTKSAPSDEQINHLADNLKNIISDIPADMNSPEGKQLKEKVINNKFDTMLDGLGGLKGFALQALERISKQKRGAALLGFFAKSYGLDSNDMKKLLDRPYIKAGVDLYMQTITDKQKMKSDQYTGKQVEIKDREIKTTYFKNSQNIVLIKEGNNRTCKKIDKTNKLIPIDKTADADLWNKYLEDKNGTAAAKMDIHAFISEDLNGAAISEYLRAIYLKKYGADIPADKLFLLTDGKEIVYQNLKDILKEQTYIYSTQDLMGKLADVTLPAIEKKIAETPAAPATPDTPAQPTPPTSTDKPAATPPAGTNAPAAQKPDQSKTPPVKETPKKTK